MPLEDLLSRLQQESDEQVSSLLREAQLEAERIVREAEAAAGQAQSARLAAREATLRADSAGALEQVRAAGRRGLLEARHRAVERVLVRVQALLPGTGSDPRYLESVGAELDRAIEVLGGCPAVLTTSPGVAERVQNRLPATIELRADPALSGFRLRSVDGRIEVDGTLDGRLRRLTPALAIAAAQALERES